jgi:TetR/AcrR family transcriptional repressor of the ameABC operon
LARRPRRSSAETRAEILATAENLFRSAGYEKTSVHDIAATIGMSPANVFKHFPSKMVLVEAIGEAHLGHIAAALEAIPADLAPPLRLRRFAGVVLEGHLDNMENNPHVFDIVAAMIAMRSAVGRNFDAVLRRHVEAIICSGNDTGDFSVPDPAATAVAVLDCLAGTSHPLLINPEARAELSVRMAHSLDLVIAALRGGLEK